MYPYYNVVPAQSHLPASVPAVYPPSYLTQYPRMNQYTYYTAYNPAYTAYNPAYTAYKSAYTAYNPAYSAYNPAYTAYNPA